MAKLEELPVELILAVLGKLDVPELLDCRLVSSAHKNSHLHWPLTLRDMISGLQSFQSDHRQQYFSAVFRATCYVQLHRRSD